MRFFRETGIEILGHTVQPIIETYRQDDIIAKIDRLDYLVPFRLTDEQLDTISKMFGDTYDSTFPQTTTTIDILTFLELHTAERDTELIEIFKVLDRFFDRVDLLNAERNSSRELAWTYGGWNG